MEQKIQKPEVKEEWIKGAMKNGKWIWMCSVCNKTGTKKQMSNHNCKPEVKEEWIEGFNKLWLKLKDWVGSGFRYKNVEYTAEGMDRMEGELKDFIKSLLQKQKQEIIDETRKKVEMEKYIILAGLLAEGWTLERYLNTEDARLKAEGYFKQH